MSLVDDYGQPIENSDAGSVPAPEQPPEAASIPPGDDAAPVAPDLTINQTALQVVIDMLERGIERHNVRSHQADELLNSALASLKGFVP